MMKFDVRNAIIRVHNIFNDTLRGKRLDEVMIKMHKTSSFLIVLCSFFVSP